MVYVNNTGTTFENNILLNVTIPIGFSYEDGTTIITFPKGSSNQDPQIKGAGAYLEWNLTDIMTAGTGVVINEILPNPIGTSDGANERVELCNAGNATVNVSGWYIHDAAGNKRDIESYKIYGSVLMEPGSFLVISIRYLDNGGDEVILYDNLNNQIDSVSYPNSESYEGMSWACIPDGTESWNWRESTLGYANGDLAPGEYIRVVFNLTAGCNAPSEGWIESEISYHGGSSSRDSSLMPVKRGFLELTKTPAVVDAVVADVVNWTIRVENTGFGPVYNVRLNDTLTSGLNLLAIDSPGGGMNWSYDAIPPGEARTVNISANVTGCRDLWNLVNASWGCDGSPCQETDAKARVTVVSAGIDVDKRVDKKFGEVCTNVTFTIFVNNTGNVPLNQVVVTDTLPLGLEYVSSVQLGYRSGNVVVWNLGEVHPGQPKIVRLVAHINGSAFGELQNVVVVEGKPEHGDNVTAEDSENVTALRADITVNKTVDRPIAKFGDIVNFTIVVTNAGNATLDPVIVTDTLPFCFEYNSSVPAGVHSGGVVTWDLGRLNATDWRVIYLEAKVNCTEAGVLENQVEVEGKPEQGDNVTANDTAEVAIVRNLTITKVADKYEVKRGEVVTYTITVCNHGGLDETNVTVWDVFNRRVDILSMTPAPDPDGKWRFDVIPAKKDEADTDNCRSIIIKIKVPERQDFEFGMEQGVSGEGFVNVANDFSTTFQAYLLKNCAYATSDEQKTPISACVTVTVGKELGTQLSTRQYGSGRFDVEERVAIYTANKSIEWEEDLSAAYRPTTLTLYHNRTVAYDSAWVKKARAKNYITGTTMSETYHDAVRLDRESRIFLDENQSLMEVDSSFDGRGHIGFLKMPSGASSPRATPIFEAREDYVGSFKVLERVDEYGSSVSSEKAASGKGLVVIDKRVGSSQRTYESGTGSYDSEELIKTHFSYIAKDISLVHSPISQRLTDSTSINASMKWKEGIYSRNPGTSFIGEEYTGLTELDKETVARGLNEMETEAYFSGRGMYRTVLKDEVDFDEVYEGDYSIERRVLFTGVSKYNRPHLNVTKTLEDVYQETLPWDNGEPHLEGAVKKRWVAVYTITIENDGDRSLDPVLVKDHFPPGAIFIEPSSVRPEVLTDTSANWTIPALTVGGVSQITLLLDVTKYYPDELVNRVEVCGGYDGGDDWICAANYSALEVRWLTCCLDEAPYEAVSVVKTGEIDPANPRVVRYRIDVSNHDGATRVATVTDSIPAGMDLLETSIPFASYEGGVVVWQILDIGPFETKTIEFSVLAPSEGRFTNSVEVDARSVDGPVVQPVYATCVIDVGVVEDECGPAGCGPWKPPNWQFEHAGYDPDRSTCELLTCTGCDGTESCLAP